MRQSENVKGQPLLFRQQVSTLTTSGMTCHPQDGNRRIPCHEPVWPKSDTDLSCVRIATVWHTTEHCGATLTMPKPHQTYLYLNRRQRIHHRAARSNLRYNIARVTAQQASLSSEALFENALENLQDHDLQPFQRQTVELAHRQSQGMPLPESLLKNWIQSEDLQRIMSVVSHAVRCDKQIRQAFEDRRTQSRVRALFIQAKKVAQTEEILANATREVRISGDQGKAPELSSYAGQLQFLAMATLIAILISLAHEWRQRKR